MPYPVQPPLRVTLTPPFDRVVPWRNLQRGGSKLGRNMEQQTGRTTAPTSKTTAVLHLTFIIVAILT
jgi:hypothetical protein